MAIRVMEMRRLLKPTGSIYLHCDPTASHYLKLLLDSVFGTKQFRNEIAWRRGKGATRTLSAQFPRNHDYLLWYSKSSSWSYQRSFKPYSKKTLAMYRHNDNGGRYRLQELRTYGEETINKFRLSGKIAKSRTGREYLKQYLSDKPGVAVDSIWEDIGGMAHGAGKERLGYPTQKPLKLLDRIIKASSVPDDVILDPFCGCATACIAAEHLQRQWAGIDISSKAAELVRVRMNNELGLFYNGAHRTDAPLRTDLGRTIPYNDERNKRYPTVNRAATATDVSIISRCVISTSITSAICNFSAGRAIHSKGQNLMRS